MILLNGSVKGLLDIKSNDMQTTFTQQIEAIRKAMVSRKRIVERNGRYQDDPNWIALNDAASTIASLNLTKDIKHQYVN
jgi:hypothetical protein